jgi:hypothetical protein
MFKNRELRVRVVKTDQGPDAPSNPTPNPYKDPEKMADIAKDLMRQGAKVAVVVLATSFILTAAEKLIDKALETN